MDSKSRWLSRPRRRDPLRGLGAIYVVGMCAEEYGVELSVLLSSSRKAPIAWARRLAAHVLRHELAMSLEQIGEVLRRDQSSVHYLLAEEGVDFLRLRKFRESVRSRLERAQELVPK